MIPSLSHCAVPFYDFALLIQNPVHNVPIISLPHYDEGNRKMFLHNCNGIFGTVMFFLKNMHVLYECIALYAF